MDLVAQVGQESYARIVATLIRATGDWTLAEDCAQDALAEALERWPREGVPRNPGGWLTTVARNRAIDVLRRSAVETRKLKEVAMLWGEQREQPEIQDDRLRLIFTCCHPALALDARVALTLRIVAGVPTPDIARAFVVSESTMTRRITRAKSKIADARIPYRVPEGGALVGRLTGVLGVLYLLFTRGYDADGEPAFAAEAIRLARLLGELMPDEPEVASLLALFLLQHSRRHARRDAAGELVMLERQDRSRWDHAAIAEALKILARTPVTGPYALQARIAACHASAETAAGTDWRSIAQWYDELARVQPTSVVALNRAVAHGYAYGPQAGLDLLAEADGVPDGYARAVEADLSARAGDQDRAAELFREAARQAPSEVERRALLTRADEVGAATRDRPDRR
ncbi:sigma-70 family RNA polymerase sigma factor [Actinoplanes sp. TBRC 11911]|uniref:RNA polymerase sigma factor n=1 Tax=Actinoplanes sp. TBRC 11911 TaxID=2729386 RepID=UPI00145EB8EF|nr:sigma-70 family RNA polymerase sigma factor [Actinoplanes sp. TBRC 11911]NMO54813.1 sigma-70 family RNA polymerase sigma factor [Actinoplanes sp. TBRC 11911]